MKSGGSDQEEREAHLRVWILDLLKSSVCVAFWVGVLEREREEGEREKEMRCEEMRSQC